MPHAPKDFFRLERKVIELDSFRFHGTRLQRVSSIVFAASHG
jgi:hypothetical protein